MEIFNLMKEKNAEQIAFYSDQSVKLRAILAVHSTALGPALGGIRIHKYDSTQDALFDILRLAQAMTFKTAAAGLNFGGGEIVVLEQPGMEHSEALFRALGRFIDSFKGRYIGGEDLGITEEAVEFMRMETKYVTGLPAYNGGSGKNNYMCAYSTLLGLLSAAKYRWGNDNISGKKILIQGYGRIGTQMAEFLSKRDANVFVTDINPEKMKKAQDDGFKTLPLENMLTETFDIISPCALGAVITPQTAHLIQCEIIAGSSNNQLLNQNDDAVLKKRNILYTPDFIINAGAIIDVAEEYLGYNEERSKRKIENIYQRVQEILHDADKNDSTTNMAALQYAQKRIESIKQIKGTFTGKGKA